MRGCQIRPEGGDGGRIALPSVIIQPNDLHPEAWSCNTHRLSPQRRPGPIPKRSQAHDGAVGNSLKPGPGLPRGDMQGLGHIRDHLTPASPPPPDAAAPRSLRHCAPPHPAPSPPSAQIPQSVPARFHPAGAGSATTWPSRD